MPLPSIPSTPVLTVVIASLCDEARAELIKRACDSVRSMAQGFEYSIVVVANGSRVSPGVLEWLGTQPDIQVVRLRTGSHPLARRVGAELARGEFIAFLDDDDELLPSTLASKLAYFRDHPECDVLITDGIRVTSTEEIRIFPPPERRSTDLTETMMRAGWSACSITLRSATVDLSVLDTQVRYMEWTLMAFELARRYGVGYLDQPTFRYYDNTPGSLSKSNEYLLGEPMVWRRLVHQYAGTRHDGIVRRRYAIACHNAARVLARDGSLRHAWRYHLRSLSLPGGTTYLPYSLRLFASGLRRLIA